MLSIDGVDVMEDFIQWLKIFCVWTLRTYLIHLQ